MGYDHAEGKEMDEGTSPSSSSRSEETPEDKILQLETEKTWEDDRRDTIETAPDEDTFDTGELKLKHTHTHTLGMLKFRADDDDDPVDWWFASTAIPLIAATFAPMANVLSIAALVVSWRDNLQAGQTAATTDDAGIDFPDPHWCIALNIASLVCGFVGNLFLLFNFTKRVRYIVALPATIILFYFASGILIGITSSMAIHVPPGPGQVYSQGYWHAVIAAVLYFFNSMILMVNMLGYFLGHYPQHFTLTDEQRNLILQTMMFFIWLGAGGAVFARIEGWNYPDALYFCDVTILTIGFGDFYPQDNLGRGLVFPFSVGGTIILGLMVSSIHKFAGELSKDKVFRKHVETNRVNTLSRAVTISTEERRRDELEKNFDPRPGHRPTISAPLPSPPPKDFNNRTIAFQGPINDEEEKEKEDKNELEPSATQFLTHKSHKGPLHRTFMMIVAPVRGIQRMTTKSTKAIIMEQEKDRFDAMRNIQIDARKFKKWYALGISTLAFGTLWCVGALVFWQCEKNTQGMTYFQGLYFCYVSLLTIGYGDLSPKSNAGKPFFIVWSLIAVPTMTILISDMGDTVIKSFKQGTFKLADFTVLPKQGLYKDFMQANPWLWNWLQRRAQAKRVKKGFEVGPKIEPGDEGLPTQTIEQLANEKLNEAEMTKKLAFAIRKTADDLRHHATNPKRYTYEEWVEFTRLIRFTKIDVKDLEQDEEQEGVVEWDWLAENSPMLSEQSEAEWVLDRLCESLLRLLKKNKLGLDHTDSESQNALGTDIFSRSRSNGVKQDENIGPKDGPGTAAKPEPTISKLDERRQRAIGADKMLTFFTGERRGANAYGKEAMWSKKALERQKDRRRSSAGAVKRMGVFAKLEHSGPKGAVGGGRGGAGTRTLKARQMSVGAW